MFNFHHQNYTIENLDDITLAYLNMKTLIDMKRKAPKTDREVSMMIVNQDISVNKKLPQ